MLAKFTRSKESQLAKFHDTRALALSKVDRYHMDQHALHILNQTFPVTEVGVS